jgi:hypothetical protein
VKRVAAAVGVLALSFAGCDAARRYLESDGSAPAASASAPNFAIGPPAPQPEPRQGMVYIPGGSLVAGTPPAVLPRIADEEMPGEQVILRGYYVDIFPYPNEEGAIQLTNVTQPRAAELCAAQGKRLCSEFEWERACKGPDNHIYEYGDTYRPERCGTGAPPALRPSGLRVGCRSEWGVFDLHGGPWEWTSSRWGRGSDDSLLATRGGNSSAGELVGRCANAMPRSPSHSSESVGFRCCAGEPNTAEVVLHVKRVRKLEQRDRVDRELVQSLLAALPADVKIEHESFAPDRMWDWRPMSNDALVVVTGCASPTRRPSCGAIVGRVLLDRVEVLGYAASGLRMPTVQIGTDPDAVWMLSADNTGRFARRIGYAWGRVSIGPIDRRTPDDDKRKRRGKRRSAE